MTPRSWSTWIVAAPSKDAGRRARRAGVRVCARDLLAAWSSRGPPAGRRGAHPRRRQLLRADAPALSTVGRWPRLRGAGPWGGRSDARRGARVETDHHVARSCASASRSRRSHGGCPPSSPGAEVGCRDPQVAAGPEPSPPDGAPGDGTGTGCVRRGGERSRAAGRRAGGRDGGRARVRLGGDGVAAPPDGAPGDGTVVGLASGAAARRWQGFAAAATCDSIPRPSGTERAARGARRGPAAPPRRPGVLAAAFGPWRGGSFWFLGDRRGPARRRRFAGLGGPPAAGRALRLAATRLLRGVISRENSRGGSRRGGAARFRPGSTSRVRADSGGGAATSWIPLVKSRRPRRAAPGGRGAALSRARAPSASCLSGRARYRRSASSEGRRPRPPASRAPPRGVGRGDRSAKQLAEGARPNRHLMDGRRA
jgi:hypothetical protein